MRLKSLLFLFFTAGLGLAQLQGQTPVPELENLRTGFDLKAAQFDEEIHKLAGSYRKHLEGQIPVLQGKGNLEAILAVKEEVKDPGESSALGSHPELKRAQDIFLKNRERIMGERKERLAVLSALYRKNLQDLMSTLTKAGRLDDALVVKEELKRAEGPVEVRQPNLGMAASRSRESVSFLEKAEVALKEIADEKVQDRLRRDVALAYAKAGNTKQALSIARKIKDSALQGRTWAEIAITQAKLGEIDQAIATSKTAPDSVNEDRALAGIAAVQIESGQTAQAGKTASKIRGPAGAALHAVDLAMSLHKKGDLAGFKKQIDAAKALAQKLETQGEMKEVFRSIVVAQVKAGEVGEAKATADLYHGHRFGSPLIDIIGAQAQTGDYRGANATFDKAGFTMFPACVAVALIAEAQADAGRFDEARATANRLWYSDHKLIALASVATKKGDLAAARAAAAGLLTADHMDGNRSERYARALAPTAVLQAKLEGVAATAAWAGSLSDPVVRCLAWTALGEATIQQDSPATLGSQP